MWKEDTRLVYWYTYTGEEAHASAIATVVRAADIDTGVAGEAQAKIWFAQDGWFVYILLVHGEGSRPHDGPTMV